MAVKSTLSLFNAAVANSRAIDHAIRTFRQDCNRRLKADNAEHHELYGKIYGTLFCMWSEAVLMRIIYIPHGFSDAEINVILNCDTVEKKWKKCLSYAFKKSEVGEQKMLKQSVGPTLERLIFNYITTPTQLRNKIAHGQWREPFNSSGSALNKNTKILMDLTDIVEIDRWFYVFKELAQIIEDGIESGDRAFRRDVWKRLSTIESELERRKSWTLVSKRQALLRHQKAY